MNAHLDLQGIETEFAANVARQYHAADHTNALFAALAEGVKFYRYYLEKLNER